MSQCKRKHPNKYETGKFTVNYSITIAKKGNNGGVIRY